MSTPITRRSLLVGAAGAGAVAIAAPAVALPPDPEIEALVELSRDVSGCVHIERASIIDSTGVVGTLPLSADEAANLQAVLASGDFTPFQQRGLYLDGRRFFFIRSDDEGTVVHAVRPDEFATVRIDGARTVVATSRSDMAPGRAVEAIYQFVTRRRALA